VIETLWILFVILLALDLLLVAVRISMVNVRMPYLVSMRDQDSNTVEKTIRHLENPRMRVSLRLGILLLHFMLLGTSIWLYLQYFGGPPGVWGGMVLLALAALLLLVLEFAIEGLILPRAEVLALRFLPVASVLDFLVSPISALLLLLLGTPGVLENRLNAVTEDELKTWVEEGQTEGGLEQGERRMIYSIFQFGDTLAREIMVPRIDVQALEVNTPVEEAMLAMTQSGHSRVPVYELSVDNVVGVLYAKDLLRARMEGQNQDSIRTLLRQGYFVPEAKKVDELLHEMQLRSVHMALVVDEYGGIAGLVTLEDIVEEIVGEIRDEYDESEELLYQEVGPGEFVFQGRIDLDDFNEVMNSNLTKDVADTLGGFIYGQIGRVPVGGEQVEVDNLVLKVEQVSGRRIRAVRASIRAAGPEVEETEKQDETER
jgi:putative hemolysin